MVGAFVAYGAAFVVGLFFWLLVFGVVPRLYERALKPRGVSATATAFYILLIRGSGCVGVTTLLGRYLHDVGMKWFLGS